MGVITIEILDRSGNPLDEEVTGRFQLTRAPGDAEPGRRLVFSPTLPTNRTLDNGGFRPARIYRVRLAGGEAAEGAVLRDVSGRPLAAPLTFTVATPVGETVNELFRAAAGSGR